MNEELPETECWTNRITSFVRAGLRRVTVQLCPIRLSQVRKARWVIFLHCCVTVILGHCITTSLYLKTYNFEVEYDRLLGDYENNFRLLYTGKATLCHPLQIRTMVTNFKIASCSHYSL